jgi:hypothetical protein
MKRFAPPALAALALAGLVAVAPGLYADEIGLPDSGGKVHVVVTGDTLWDIAQAYLEDPFQWPKIWRDNDQVVNPDLIFPGGRLRIPVGLLKPEIREQVVQAEVPPEVVEVPVPNGTLNPAMVESAGYIVDDLNELGEVVGTIEQHTLIGQGDPIFLKFDEETAAPGDQYMLVRPQHRVRHHGRVVHVLGVMRVSGVEGTTVHGRVERFYDHIVAGDLAVPYERPVVDITEAAPDLTGRVIATEDGRTIVAQGDVTFLDKGAADGLAPGMLLEVTTEGEKIDPEGLFNSVDVPPRPLARLRVLSVRDDNATAWVEQSAGVIQVGAPFRNAAPSEMTGPVSSTAVDQPGKSAS